MKILTIHDKEFTSFGRVITSPFSNIFAEKSFEIGNPLTGCSYLPSVQIFEEPEIVKHYSDLFGQMPIQIGYCWGQNDSLNALEWHKTSEIHVALEDMILMLGQLCLMKNNTFDTKNIKLFYVKSGESVEIYSTTLHFCPAMSEKRVFKNIVILPRGTNTALEYNSDDKTLVAKNKWLICHSEAAKQVAAGRLIGIKGSNIKI